MYGLTRGTTTLIAAAVAGLLLWLAYYFGEGESMSAYWALVGFCAAAGLVMAVSQLVGGWTKWGLPTISPTVLLLGFLPVLVAGGLVILAGQPEDGFGRGWADDIGMGWLAEDLALVIPAIAFGIGLAFGYVFDTTGERVRDEAAVARGYPREHDRVADEPLSAEREHVATGRPEREHVETGRSQPVPVGPIDHEEEHAVATRGDGRAEAPTRRRLFHRR
jgi:hypothetical protein